MVIEALAIEVLADDKSYTVVIAAQSYISLIFMDPFNVPAPEAIRLGFDMAAFSMISGRAATAFNVASSDAPAIECFTPCCPDSP